MVDRQTKFELVLVTSLLVLLCAACATETPEPEATPENFLVGRWDVTVQGQDGPYPSWFELELENGIWKGRFVGRVGSARPIQEISIEGHQLRFSLPVQYESHPEDMWFEGTYRDDIIEGTTNAEDGTILTWTARRAPSLERTSPPEWGDPIDLTAGPLEDNWRPRDPEAENHWRLQDGILENTGRGSDLVTRQEFDDFKLHLEFRCPEDSNSGVYLRGRYEVQILDDYGNPPSSVGIGGVYGFLTPTKNAGLPPGEWQSYDITLVGRRVTIQLNGETVIDNQEIPGITGGALDSNEGDPGPLMLQGDHGPIMFRNVVVTPAR
ncbi:MAG TPA: DUF1080 domain-containing protein [Acidobacteriota bacterium]|nr:DUF1080 domain-containing protein [Acidobacteriota bacterium]